MTFRVERRCDRCNGRLEAPIRIWNEDTQEAEPVPEYVRIGDRYLCVYCVEERR